MGLFERVNRVVRAELNCAKNQSTSPEQEVDRIIGMLQDAVTKARLAITYTPPDQAGHLRLTLTNLETKLLRFTTQRMEARLQKLDKLCGNDLSRLIGLFEDISNDIATMKVQAQKYLVRQE
jgi:hypothetical protein